MRASFPPGENIVGQAERVPVEDEVHQAIVLRFRLEAGEILHVEDELGLNPHNLLVYQYIRTCMMTITKNNKFLVVACK